MTVKKNTKEPSKIKKKDTKTSKKKEENKNLQEQLSLEKEPLKKELNFSELLVKTL